MSLESRGGLEVRVHRNKDVCTLSCSGDLTLGGGETVLRHRFAAVLDSGDRFLILDLTGVRYIDSSGVGEIVACSKRAFERSGVIKIVVPREGTVQRVFAITHLDRAFEIFHDEAEAAASFSA